MIGPSETYEFGFYFFNIVMPKDYPFNPQKLHIILKMVKHVLIQIYILTEILFIYN